MEHGIKPKSRDDANKYATRFEHFPCLCRFPTRLELERESQGGAGGEGSQCHLPSPIGVNGIQIVAFMHHKRPEFESPAAVEATSLSVQYLCVDSLLREPKRQRVNSK